MEEIKLDVQVRKEVGSRRIRKVKRADLIPAIVYGGKKEPTSVKVDRRTYEGIMRHHQGQSVIFHLNVLEGDKKLRDYSVILKEEQHDPVQDHVLHIDFLRISLTEEIEVNVPVEYKGDAVGVRQDGGSLDQPIHELDVICLPTNIPQKIVVDVSALKIGDSIYVRDITLPKGVRTKHDPDSMVFHVVPPMKEIPTAPTGEEQPKEPEVLKEKKKEEPAAEAKGQEAPKKAEAAKPEKSDKK